ncbi:RsiV family protein, partial [Xanthomonas perforans]|nr:RsiV family protein [Xanthomonas perforans]
IAEGTAAQAENFAQFVPVLNANGQITAVRFVFAPYQVGPYSDGTQMAEVAASTLLPSVAPEYVHLFAR